MHDRPGADAAHSDTWEIAAISALLLTATRHTDPQGARTALVSASIDQTTGLLNRQAFLDSATSVFAEARRNYAPVSTVIVDVDDLITINRTFGLEAGDAVLAHVARLIAMNIQPGVDLAARMVGAEMILLLPEADFGWSSGFAERLRGSLANRPLTFAGHLIEASACFGVASIVPGDVNLNDMIERARAAMRAAKQCGRNAVRIASDQELFAA